MSNHSTRKSSKDYKKKEDNIEYRFSNNDGESKNKPFLDVGISVEKIRKVFAKLQEIFGENNELIKEYSVYKHNDMELTVFPDGSSFCRQVSVKEVEDTTTPDGIIVTYKEKHKMSNDYFPCKFVYNSAIDVIDVVFNVKDGIKIILNTIYENNRSVEKLKTIESLGRQRRAKKSNKVWCEIYVSVECSCDVNDVHETIDLMKDIVYET